MKKSLLLSSSLFAMLLTLTACKEEQTEESAKEEAKAVSKKVKSDAKEAADSKKKEVKEFDDTEVNLKGVVGDPVVANIDGEEILFSDVLKAMQMMPPEMRKMPMDVLFLAVRDQLIDMKLMEKETLKKEKDLLKSPEVKKALEEARKKVLTAAYMKESTKSAVSEKAIKEKFKEIMKKFPKGTDEIKLHQIVVKTEEEAKKIIQDLKDGVDFFKIAREKSIDKATAKNDGRVPGYLNTLTQKQLLPGFDVLFKKKGGKYTVPTGHFTKEPIKTPMGYFVMKVMDRRPLRSPKLEEAKPLLEAQIQQEALVKHTQDLRKKSKIKRFHPNTGKLMHSLDSQIEKLKGMLMKALDDVKKKKGKTTKKAAAKK